jgi:hypothetical protein
MAWVTLSSVSRSKPLREDTITDTLLCSVAALERNTRFSDTSSGVGVQQQQHRRDDQDVAQAELEPQAAPEFPFSL